MPHAETGEQKEVNAEQWATTYPNTTILIERWVSLHPNSINQDDWRELHDLFGIIPGATLKNRDLTDAELMKLLGRIDSGPKPSSPPESRPFCSLCGSPNPSDKRGPCKQTPASFHRK